MMNIDFTKLGYRWKGLYSPYLSYIEKDVVYKDGGAYVIQNGVPVPFALGQQDATLAGQVLTGGDPVSGVPYTALHSNGAGSMEFRFMGGRNGVIATKLMEVDRMNCEGAQQSQYYMSSIMSDGSVRVWGLRSNGQTGTGSYGGDPAWNYTLPTRVAFPPGTPRITQVVSNWNDTYFLDANGAVYHCGGNRGDVMSGRNTTGATVIPTKINGFGDLGSNTVVVKIFQSGGYHGQYGMWLLDNQGRVYCWGQNAYGQLGTGNTTAINYPYLVPFTATTPIKDIYANSYIAASFLIGVNGIMYVAGEQNTSLYTATTSIHKPVMPWGFNKTVKQLFASEHGYVSGESWVYPRRYGAVLDNGEMWMWGELGAVSDGFGIGYNANVWNTNTIYPLKVLDGVSYGQCVSGYSVSMALMNDGTIKWTGYNGQGIGGASASRTTWETLGGSYLTNVTKFRLYGKNTYQTGFALRNDGKMVVWGHGGNGVVGDGYNTTANQPNKFLLIDKTIVDFSVGGQMGDAYGVLYCLTSDGQVMNNGIGVHSMGGDDDQEARFAPSPIIF